MKTNSDFSYVIADGVLCITDLDMGGRSVTNDIENVLASIRARGDLRDRIIYRDSMGVWDQVTVDHALEFAGFRSLNERELPVAVRRAAEGVPA